MFVVIVHIHKSSDYSYSVPEMCCEVYTYVHIYSEIYLEILGDT